MNVGWHPIIAVLLALLLGACTMATAATINVINGDDLQAKIDAAVGGDILVLGTGTYGGFRIEDRHFTREKPLVIRAAPGATPLILGSNYSGNLARISNSSYIVLDGLTMENSNHPIYCTSVDHLILVNLEVHNTGQEIIHIRGASRYVDIRNCRLYDTGHHRPQWAEGIYVGVGQPPFECVEHVWIEGNDIHHTANAEGINIKTQCYHVTIRGNKVHDMEPGTATQHNEGAIACEAADLSFRPGEDPDIWIENNEVYNIRFGRWANGIKQSTMGGKVINNHIHDCQQFGIAFNDFQNGPGAFTTWMFGNKITDCAAGAVDTTTLLTKSADPGVNPNQPQSWYQSPATTRPVTP
jgi:nitrous oxidase accessory protein NosD